MSSYNSFLLPAWASSSQLAQSQFTEYAIRIATEWHAHQLEQELHSTQNALSTQRTYIRDDNVNISKTMGNVNCGVLVELTVTDSYAIPSEIKCYHRSGDKGKGAQRICTWLKRIFWHNNRILPHNISFGYSYGDWTKRSPLGQMPCFGSSSEDGLFNFPNMEEILAIASMLGGSFDKSFEDREYQWQYIQFNHSSWGHRDPTPIFRGTAWLGIGQDASLCLKLPYKEVLEKFHKRLKAVDFSKDHPGLLNARFHRAIPSLQECFDSAQSGFSKLLPFVEQISAKNYYSKYQTAVVLGGYGAAYRLSKHLMAGQAVVLQEYKYQEWYTHLLKPWIHFIPLKEDLSDLYPRMIWIRENPGVVERIALQGRAFYEEFLTWNSHEMLVHEVIFRISEYAHSQKNQLEVSSISSSPDLVKMETVAASHEQSGGFIRDNIEFCRVLLDHHAWRKPLGQKQKGLHFIAHDCGNQGSSILGNHLTRWYMMRIIAASAGAVVSASCSSDVMDWLQTKDVLPSQAKVLAEGNFSWSDLCMECISKRHCVYPHEKPGLESAIPIIKEDMQGLAQGVITRFSPEIDDVVIHIRVGDIGRQKHELYGLLPFAFYRKYIPEDAKSIGIVTAPFKQKRRDWGHGDAELNAAVVVGAKTYLEAAFPAANVSIWNSIDETMDVAYTRQIAAKRLLICGPSTFCLIPALGRTSKSIIVQSPLFGGRQSWLVKVAMMDDRIEYVDEPYFASKSIFDKNVSDILALLRE